MGLLALAVVASVPFAVPSLAQTEGSPPAATQPQSGSGNVSGIAQGTEEALLDPNLYVNINEAYQRHIALRKPEVEPQDMKTILFTLWQHKLLEEQRRIGVVTRAPGPGEPLDSPGDRVRGPRELALGGIVYATSQDWVVWLNNMRVTPDAIPEQVIDIQVKKDYIEIKWFDSWTNLIFPIRLRPHQRFNLDTRIFLPGTASL